MSSAEKLRRAVFSFINIYIYTRPRGAAASALCQKERLNLRSLLSSENFARARTPSRFYCSRRIKCAHFSQPRSLFQKLADKLFTWAGIKALCINNYNQPSSQHIAVLASKWDINLPASTSITVLCVGENVLSQVFCSVHTHHLSPRH